MIKFVLMVNKQGQTRLAQYYDNGARERRNSVESELIRLCLVRTDKQCSFFEYGGFKIVYRRYASLYFILGLSSSEDENEMCYLEFIHCLVETLDRYFENVCELDIMFNLEKVHIVLDEMICNGYISETNKALSLMPLTLTDKVGQNT